MDYTVEAEREREQDSPPPATVDLEKESLQEIRVEPILIS
jgi:hypothetical protein